MVEERGERPPRQILKRGRELRPRALQWERGLEEVEGVDKLVVGRH